MTTRRAFLGLAAAALALPYQTSPMRPTAEFHYDERHPDEHSVCRVYCDTSIAYATGTRPVIFTLKGGGWHPNSGTVGKGWKPNAGSLLERLYLRGWAVIHMAYTVADDALPNRGAFHPAFWLNRGGKLQIDETTHASRHMERDAVLAVQALRYRGLPAVPDLDLSPGAFWFHGRSAGTLAGNWLAFGPDRADRGARDPKRRVSTEIAGVVQQQHIANIGALGPGFQQYHLADGAGNLPSPVGQVPRNVIGASSHLRWGVDYSKKPCYLSGDGNVHWTGPHDWANFQGVLTGVQIHASDHVVATSQMPGHHPASVFVTGPVSATWDADVEQWITRLEEARG